MKKLIVLLALCTTINAKGSADILIEDTTLDKISSETCVEGNSFSICELDILGRRACYVDMLASHVSVPCSMFDEARFTVKEVQEREAIEASKLFKVK